MTQQNRRHKRAKHHGSVRISGSHGQIMGRCEDISVAGLFASGPSSLTVGSGVNVELLVDGSHTRIPGIVQRRDNRGVAVRFTGIGAMELIRLHKYVASRTTEAGRAGALRAQSIG